MKRFHSADVKIAKKKKQPVKRLVEKAFYLMKPLIF